MPTDLCNWSVNWVSAEVSKGDFRVCVCERLGDYTGGTVCMCVLVLLVCLTASERMGVYSE